MVAAPGDDSAGGAVAPAFELPVLPTRLDLPFRSEEGWSFELIAEGCWSQPLRTAAAGGEHAVPGHELVLWPTGRLVGRIELPNGEPREPLGARFAPPAQGSPDAGPAGEVICSSDSSSFECELPATELDVRLGLPGFAPHYLWEVPVEAAKRRDVGILRMVPGASVAGRVEWSGDPEEVTVTLTPEVLGVPPPAVGRRLGSRSIDVGVDRRGHFQIMGLAAGSYVAGARAGERAASIARDGIVIEEAVEVYLDEPLRIEPPAAVQVFVSPAFDDLWEPWTVTLQRELPGSSFVETVTSAVTDADGSVELIVAAPGFHHLLVADSRGDRLHRGTLELRGRPVRVDVEIAAVVVRGEVERGGEPLEARLLFTSGGGERTELHTDADGRFSGRLGAEGSWMVEVSPKAGPSRRLLGRRVEVVRGEDGVAWVPIELPATRLAGSVEDEEGEIVPRALVSAFRGDRPLAQVWSDDGGIFELDGLEPGLVTLRAESRDGRQSEVVRVDLEEDESAEPLALIVSPSLRLPLEIRFQGLPVAGARIRYFMPGGSVQGEVTTGPSGRAELLLPPRTAAVDIVALAARLPTRILRLRLHPQQARQPTARIDLPSEPGTLLVPVERQRRRIVFGGEVELMISNLLRPSGSDPPAEFDAAAGVLTFHIGEGRYGLCDDERSRCTEGNLAPGGVLDLRSGRQSRERSEEPSPV